ncbi:SMG6 [Acrasis kona]|uniref:SMG6 n=1 Tax=Acrasis kona TaxID=1008807 RepID=A0AAW2ZMA7_9EUKA
MCTCKILFAVLMIITFAYCSTINEIPNAPLKKPTTQREIRSLNRANQNNSTSPIAWGDSLFNYKGFYNYYPLASDLTRLVATPETTQAPMYRNIIPL